MVGAAAEMRFEEAAVYKKRIEALAAYQSKSVVVSNTLTNLDVFSLVVDDDAAYCNFMRIADGAVVNSFTVELKPGLEDRPQRRPDLRDQAGSPNNCRADGCRAKRSSRCCRRRNYSKE